MAKMIGRNRNISDVSDISNAIALNSTISTKIADANNDRISITISNDSGNQVWIKFQAATVDNDKKGIILFARSVYEISVDNIYTGEISAIAESGIPDINVTEY